MGDHTHSSSYTRVRFPSLLNHPTNQPTYLPGAKAQTKDLLKNQSTELSFQEQELSTYLHQDLDRVVGILLGPGQKNLPTPTRTCGQGCRYPTRTWTEESTYSHQDLDKKLPFLPNLFLPGPGKESRHPYQDLNKDLGQKELPSSSRTWTNIHLTSLLLPEPGSTKETTQPDNNKGQQAFTP